MPDKKPLMSLITFPPKGLIVVKLNLFNTKSKSIFALSLEASMYPVELIDLILLLVKVVIKS